MSKKIHIKEIEKYCNENGYYIGEYWFPNKRTKPKTKMSDSEHLQWIHDRIVNVYGENENVDFLIRFRTIINEFLNQNKDGIK